MSSSVISDSACLIVLDRIDRIPLLYNLYDKIYIPDAVQKEFGKGIEGLVVKTVQNTSLVKALRMTLGAGESESIALALELPDSIIVLDDHQARQAALEMGLAITGTIGMLLKAKEAGIVGDVRSVLDELRTANFHMSEALYLRALNLAGE